MSDSRILQQDISHLLEIKIFPTEIRHLRNNTSNSIKYFRLTLEIVKDLDTYFTPFDLKIQNIKFQRDHTLLIVDLNIYENNDSFS